MKLRPGITGFFESREWKTLPAYSIRDFKQLVHAAAEGLGWAVASVTAAGTTPNFHVAHIEPPKRQVFILGHSNFPIVAFAEQVAEIDQRLRFVDEPELASEISRLFPDVAIASSVELNRSITEHDLSQLGPADRRQIMYWKPRTIGQLVFNWWD